MAEEIYKDVKQGETRRFVYFKEALKAFESYHRNRSLIMPDEKITFVDAFKIGARAMFYFMQGEKNDPTKPTKRSLGGVVEG